MLKLFSASIAVALLAGAAAPAVAQTANANAAPAQAAPARTTLDPNEVVCEKQEVLGSRLASRKVCHTRAEWADLKLQDRQDLERAQTRRGMKGE
jgi:invasion protein IalB